MNSFEHKEIQVVAFASPYPANYGGVIDVYYRLKAFHDAGVKVHLHTYIYGDHQPSTELEKICASVQYYKRENTHKYFQGWPYVVATRYNKNLIDNVKKSGYPVLLEGLHTCFLVQHLKESKIPFVVRMHNIEWKYYQFLAELEPSYIKKKYFLEEARRLKNFEKQVADVRILSISEKDSQYLREKYPHAEVVDVPPFHPYSEVEIPTGKGEYAIFHGNLSISENEQAALWLIEKIFSSLQYPLVIAGKNPGNKLIQAVRNFPHITLEANPSDVKMEQFMRDAHIHLLPNCQPTGIKIKWVNSLFTARFLIVNPEIYSTTDEQTGIYALSTPQEYKQAIIQLRDKSFTEENLILRKAWISSKYSNQVNAERVLEWL